MKTIENIVPFKIVGSEEKVQNKLFKLGCYWKASEDIFYEDRKYIYVKKDLTLEWSELEWFLNGSEDYKELTITELFELENIDEKKNYSDNYNKIKQIINKDICDKEQQGITMRIVNLIYEDIEKLSKKIFYDEINQGDGNDN